MDIGCGRGGDIMKIYHARVGNYVGIDISYEDIYSATDGAVSRYKPLKNKFPGFGKVSYIQADGGVLLNSKEQSKINPSNPYGSTKIVIEKLLNDLFFIPSNPNNSTEKLLLIFHCQKCRNIQSRKTPNDNYTPPAFWITLPYLPPPRTKEKSLCTSSSGR